MENDIDPVIKEEIEKLKYKHEALRDKLMECEDKSIRLKAFSNQIYQEIEENKAERLRIEIGLKQIEENIQQLNLS